MADAIRKPWWRS